MSGLAATLVSPSDEPVRDGVVLVEAEAAAKGLLEKRAEGHRASKPVFAHPSNGIEGLPADVRYIIRAGKILHRSHE